MTNSVSAWTRIVDHINEGNDTDERYTPVWVLDLVEAFFGGIDLDPASDPQRRVPARKHYTKVDDGLSQGWSGKVFLNPPFSKTSAWIKHLCIYCHSGAITEAIVLVPVMALANKSSILLMERTATCFTLVRKQLSFLDGDYREMGAISVFPFAMVYVGNRTDQFLDATGDIGTGCLIRNQAENAKNSLCSYCGKPFVAKRSTAKYCGSTCRVESYRKRLNC